MIGTGCRLLDVGCGTGDLLFKANDKIRFGLGIDSDPRMVNFANKKKRAIRYENLEFVQADINSYEKLLSYEIDIASSTLCLHEMKEDDAIKTLELLAKISPTVLIADYSKPSLLSSKLSIELDELISGHYYRFKRYRKNGYLPYLARRAGLEINQVTKPPIDGILIWDLKRRTSNTASMRHVK